MADKLSSGMSPAEAVRRASAWWETWRHEVPKQFNTEIEADRVRGGGTGNILGIVKGGTRPTIPSGILNALPWDALSRKEKQRVVAIWHHNHVTAPATGVDPVGRIRYVGKGGRTTK